MSERPKAVRCAVYTRKSTEHNLDLEFNSLHAQREACEAYIKSQMHEGWQLCPETYDDGDISGASLDRPDLQRLLADIAAGRVNIVVVYKVDRLTRSLTDFAKLVEIFDKHGASFVSVTQSFNTTTSMGRLTLNVLLSFAQFEREVIAERVRDKIAASKRKGIWMGGQVPLGYTSVEKKLIVVPDEAEIVRWIFQRYLELSAIMPLLKELYNSGFRTKKRQLANGRVVGGCKFGKGGLNHLLKNRFYVGEIHHHGTYHVGCHEPIVGKELFEAVQIKLKANNVQKRLTTPNAPFLLAGYIFDSDGNRMTPSHTVKKGARYRYYVSQTLLQGRRGKEGQILRVSAPTIEAKIEQFIRDRFPGSLGDLRMLVTTHISRITIQPGYIEVAPLASEAAAGALGQAEEPVRLPWAKTPSRAPKGVVSEPSLALQEANKAKEALLRAIGRARRWVSRLTAGEEVATIAREEGRGERQIRLLLPLAFVAPDMVRDILENHVPVPGITELAKRVPLVWEIAH